MTASEFKDILKNNNKVNVIIDDEYPQYGFAIELDSGEIIHLQAKSEYDVPSIEFKVIKTNHE